MNHKLIFSGQPIDLARKDVVQQLEASLLQFYPQSIVKLKSYTEINPKTAEIVVERSYNGAARMGINQCINYHDMSLITGLDISAFEPWNKKAMIGALIPWSDDMVYAPDQVFADLYMQQNDKMVNEQIKKVDIHPGPSTLKIRVEYDV